MSARNPRPWRSPLLPALALLCALVLAPSARGSTAPLVHAVESVGVTVNDMERAIAFYTQALGFEREQEEEVSGEELERLYGVFGLRLRTVRLKLGDERLELMQFLAPRGRPIPVDSKSNDRWFQHVAIIVSDMDRAYAHLRAHKVEHASSGPQVLPAWNQDAGGIAAFYFRDPDGNPLEVLQFPPDKGAPKWRRTDRLFLGIDHTAVVVADTESSLRFYRDALGMRIAGMSENHGVEQERLNNVFGARLRITALRAADGPGVELLEYLAPRTGRPMPADTLANDDWHWQVNVDADVDAAAAATSSFQHVSPGIVSGRLLLRDPDGHALLFR